MHEPRMDKKEASGPPGTGHSDLSVKRSAPIKRNYPESKGVASKSADPRRDRRIAMSPNVRRFIFMPVFQASVK